MLFCTRLLFVTLIALMIFQVQSYADPITAGQITVRDGDLIKARGYRWRMTGYDTPEIWSQWRTVSPAEKELGRKAKSRFKELLKIGPLDLTEEQCCCPASTIGTTKCNYGRKCGLLTLNGRNIGDQLIAEGLAEKLVCRVLLKRQ